MATVKKAKKRGPQDLTLRNLRAMRKKLKNIEGWMQDHQIAVNGLTDEIGAVRGLLEVLRNESDEAWRRIVTLEQTCVKKSIKLAKGGKRFSIRR